MTWIFRFSIFSVDLSAKKLGEKEADLIDDCLTDKKESGKFY